MSMVIMKEQKKAKFVAVDLSQLDPIKTPQPLNTLIDDIQRGCQTKYDRDRHEYHSDEPKYDHWRPK